MTKTSKNISETQEKTKKNPKGAYDRIILVYKKDPYMHPEAVVKEANTSMRNLLRLRATDEFKIEYKRIKNQYDYEEIRRFREKVQGLEDVVIDIAKTGKFEGDRLRAIEFLLGKDYFVNKLKQSGSDDDYIIEQEKDEIRSAIQNLAHENQESGETIDDLFGDTETAQTMEAEVQTTPS